MRARAVPWIRVEGRINGNQKVARVRESGRGMGVEVTERDHDNDRERVSVVISPPDRSQQDKARTYTRDAALEV